MKYLPSSTIIISAFARFVEVEIKQLGIMTSVAFIIEWAGFKNLYSSWKTNRILRLCVNDNIDYSKRLMYFYFLYRTYYAEGFVLFRSKL